MFELTISNLVALIMVIATVIVIYISRRERKNSDVTHFERNVIGSPDFVKKVSAAVRLLKESSEYGSYYEEHILSIIEVDQNTGTYVSHKPARFDLSTEYAMGTSLTWLASVLIHEATRVDIKHDISLGPVSNSFTEMMCNKEQIKCLYKIGGTAFEINYLKAVDGRPFNTNGNGILDTGGDWIYVTRG